MSSLGRAQIGKKKVSLLLLALVSIFILIAIDPDLGFIKDLPYGAMLLMILKDIVLTILFIVVIEVVPEVFVKEKTDNEEDLVNIAKRNSEGASRLILSRSIDKFVYLGALLIVVNYY